jgi:hypothetical protein
MALEMELQFFVERFFCARAAENTAEPVHVHDSSFGRVQEQADDVAQALPFGDFGVHLTTTFFRERIEFGFAAGFGFLPYGVQPATVFQAMQRGIKRALTDLEKVFGDLAEALGDGGGDGGAIPFAKAARCKFSVWVLLNLR